MSIIAISQARMGSTRFPGKVLADLHGKSLLQHHIDRVKEASELDHHIIATSVEPRDDVIADTVLKQGGLLFRGSELNVLDRFYHAARAFKPSLVVRLTCDCPLLDPYLIDQIIRAHIYSDADYTSNTLKRSYAKGLDVEVFNFKALERAYREATTAYDREHVTPYIYRSGKFKTQNIAQKTDDSRSISLCVDTLEDLNVLRDHHDL